MYIIRTCKIDLMTLKVISLNIWHGKFLYKVIDYLKAENADLVLLQEVYNGHDPNLAEAYRSMQILTEQLGYLSADYGYAYTELTDFGAVEHGNAVFSKFPFITSEMVYMNPPVKAGFEYHDIPEHWPLLPSPLQEVVVETAQGDLNVFNMHGPWDLDGDSFSERRRRMQQTIVRATQGITNVILAGDSNAKTSNEALTGLEPRLTSVFGHELISTFNMRHKDNPGYATAAVDVAFVSPNIKIRAKECPDVDISDHLPLVVTLDIT